MARIRPLRVRQGSAAACCAAVAVLAVAALAGCSSHAPAAATTATARADSPQGMAAACSKPSTPFARFWYITTGPDQTFYKGTFRVGTARVPSLSMYVSGGPPGAGTFCVSAQHGAQVPIQSTAAPRPGPIAYAGAAGQGNIVYFATRPDVTRVTADIWSGTSYTLDGTGQLQLQPLGNGWHAAGTGYGIGGVSSVTLRAYNSAGKLIDTVTQPINASQ